MKRVHFEEEKGPERVGEVLARLFTARGWGRRQGQLQLEQAWSETVGTAAAPHTRVGSFRRGTLEIFVDNAVLLQELVHFQKRRLLEQLRRRMPGATIHDLRFRTGTWEKSR
jgi:predicted nucleic acid-binding Zn ribbon protein